MAGFLCAALALDLARAHIRARTHTQRVFCESVARYFFSALFVFFTGEIGPAAFVLLPSAAAGGVAL